VSQHDAARYIRAVYRREHVSNPARRRITMMVRCAYSPKAGVNMRRLARREARARVARRRILAVVAPYGAYFDRVAVCESGGNWATNTGNGFYGGLQFTMGSWRAVGGRGMPHHATKLEQKYRAVRLLKIQGRGAWPVCGR